MKNKLYILLDRSGSMGDGNLWKEAVNSINSYVKNVGVNMKVNDSNPVVEISETLHITLAIFDYEYNIIRDCYLYDWKDVSETEAEPRGMTALYDATGRLYNKAFSDNPENAVFVLMTDGKENCSREFNLNTIKELGKKTETKGWSTVYLGANFKDIVEDAITRGGRHDTSVFINFGNFDAAALLLGSKTANYYNTTTMAKARGLVGSDLTNATASAAINFTEEDKENLAK